MATEEQQEWQRQQDALKNNLKQLIDSLTITTVDLGEIDCCGTAQIITIRGYPTSEDSA